MAGNTDLLVSKVADIQAAPLINAVAAVLYNASGTIGTDVYKVWQADATNGGFLQRVRVKYVANATTTSNACIMKLYISSAASGAVTDTNSWFFDEIVIAATGALTTTASSNAWEVPFGFALPPNYTVLAKITVAQPANCGFIAMGIGGKY
jgi:hypothetical protein